MKEVAKSKWAVTTEKVYSPCWRLNKAAYSTKARQKVPDATSSCFQAEGNIKNLHFSMLFINHNFLHSRLVKQNQLLEWYVKTKQTNKKKHQKVLRQWCCSITKRSVHNLPHTDYIHRMDRHRHALCTIWSLTLDKKLKCSLNFFQSCI